MEPGDGQLDDGDPSGTQAAGDDGRSATLEDSEDQSEDEFHSRSSGVSYFDTIEPGDLITSMRAKLLNSLINTKSCEIGSGALYLSTFEASNTTMGLPEYRVEPLSTGDGFKLIFRDTDNRSTIKSSRYSSHASPSSTPKRSKRERRTMKIPENWVHDFTFQFLESNTDQQLSKYFPVLKDDCDNCTPDTIIQISDAVFAIIEYATRETKNVKTLKMGCQEKYNKYLLMLKNRKKALEILIGKPVQIFFGVICSGPSQVVSNFNLDDGIVEQLCLRQRIAYSVESQLEPYGVMGRKELESTALEKKCAITLANIRINSNIMNNQQEFPEWSQKLKEEVWDGPVNGDLVQAQLDKIKEKIIEEGEDNLRLSSLALKRNKINALLTNYRETFKCLKQGGENKCTKILCGHEGDDIEEDDSPPLPSYVVNGEPVPSTSRGEPVIREPPSDEGVPLRASPGSTNLTSERTREEEHRRVAEEIEMMSIENLVEKEMIELQSLLYQDLKEKTAKHHKDLSEGDRKKDMKAIIQFPFIPMIANYTHMEEEIVEIVDSFNNSQEFDSHSRRVWENAFRNHEEHLDDSQRKGCPYSDHCCPACGDIDTDIGEPSVNSDGEEQQSDCKEFIDSIYDGGVNKGANDRSIYKRVSLKGISESDKLDLALQGVDGKKYALNPAKIMKENESRKPYHKDTLTKDIEEFIMKKWPLLAEEVDYGIDTSELATNELLEDASKLTNDAESLEDILFSFKEVKKMSMIRASRIISDIAMEVNMSIKQHCKKDEFILKRLMGSKVYLLIRPTNSSGCIFFSILWDKSEALNGDDFAGIFKTPIQITNELWCTEFISTNKGRLTNQITVYSKLQTILWFYMNENQVNPSSYGHELPVLTEEEVNSIMNGEQVQRMLNHAQLLEKLRKVIKSTMLMMLVILHDKPEVEEHLTLVRYICMEGFVALPRVMDPTKMMEKFTTIPRSRMTLWVQEKLMDFMKSIISGGGYSGEFEKVTGSKRRKFKRSNMKNMFIDEEVNSEGELINMFYIGYGVNKSHKPESNIIGKLYEKILTWEEKFNPNQIGEIGIKEHENPLDYADHEYSNEWIKMIADHGLKLVSNQTGSNPKSYIEKAFLSSYAHQTILNTLSTLKASTDFNLGNRDPGSGKVHRLKVIEAAKEYILSDKVYMFEIVEQALQSLHDEDGIYIDLFKKNQHGGLREIYILNINTRIIQHCIESMARAVCKIFESETMTNPTSKNRLFTAHKQQVKNRFGSMNVMTHCSSDDAKKWSQGHYVAKFALMMCRLLPEKYHGLIRSICILWHKKRILIDEELLRVFKKNPGLSLGVDCIDKMAKIYTSRSEGTSWMKPGSRHICTRTGMMQGILHYTSSLLHTLHNEFLKSYLTEMVKSYLMADTERFIPSHSGEDDGARSKVCTPVITVMQSSDDSGIIISIPCPIPEKYIHLSALLNMCFEIKHKAGRLAGIYPSEKCTSNTPGMIEFNSNWMFMNNKFNPYFKQVLACTTASGQHTLVGKQQEVYNYITSIIEFGGSMMLAFLCMLCVGELHYQLLGSTMSHLFSGHYSNKLKKLKLPSMGYFLVDNMFLAGLGGWDFLHWNLCMKTDVGDYYFLLFEANKREKIESDDLKLKALSLDIATSGLFSSVTSLKFGANYKLMRIKDSFPIPPNWLERLNDDPRPMIATPKTPDEKLLKIATLLHGPGIQSSFNDVDCTSSVASAAGYHLKFACYYVDSAATSEQLTPATVDVITDQTSWADEGISEEKKREKLNEIMRQRAKSLNKLSLMSVLQLTRRVKSNLIEANDIENKTFLEQKDQYIKSIFPKDSDYVTVVDHIQSMPKLQLFRDDKNLLNKLSVVKVTTRDFQQYRAPYDLCLQRWFDIGRMDRRTLNNLWTALRIRFPWIQDDYKSTLKMSPFTDAIQLFNFLSRLDKNERRVNLLSIPITSTLSESDLTILMNHNLWQGFSTVNPRQSEEYGKVINDAISMRNLAHNLYMINLFPLTDEYKAELMSRLMKQVKITNVNVKSQRLQRLLSMVMFLKDRPEEEVLKTIRDGNFGVLGSYTRPQRFDPKTKTYRGLGVWEGTVSSIKIKIIVHAFGSEGTQIVKVVISSPMDSKVLIEFLREWCEDNHVLNDEDWRKKDLQTIKDKIVRNSKAQRFRDTRRFKLSEELMMGMCRFSPCLTDKDGDLSCHIYVDKDYASIPSILDEGDLHIDFTDGVLRLLHVQNSVLTLDRKIKTNIKSLSNFESKMKSVTIVSHRIGFRDFAQRFVNRQSCGLARSESNRDLISCWMSHDPYPTIGVRCLIDGLLAEDEKLTERINRTQFQEFVNMNYLNWSSKNLSQKPPLADNPLPTSYAEEVLPSGLHVGGSECLITMLENEEAAMMDDVIFKELSKVPNFDHETFNPELTPEIPECLFGDFISPDANEFQVKSSSNIFDDFFESLFKQLSAKELRQLFEENLLPFRCQHDLKYYSYVMQRAISLISERDSLAEDAGYDLHFPPL